MRKNIDISGLDKKEVLKALYNASRPIGLGFINAKEGNMTDEQADKAIADANAFMQGRLYFDYVHGRVMKVNISDDELDPSMYDRDNGEGAAEEAINRLRELKDVVVESAPMAPAPMNVNGWLKECADAGLLIHVPAPPTVQAAPVADINHERSEEEEN